MDTALSPPLGQLLGGRYHVDSRIARGGMATVYLGTDTRLDRVVALKIAHPELSDDAEFVRRFIGEARSAARLSSPNVVAIFDQGSDKRLHYIAMEYVPGRTLRQLLNERGRLSVREALDIMAGVLAGLAAAHGAGFAHRDVKPENVLLTTSGTVKVADFGLARSVAGAVQTKGGLIIGTAAYLAPEQVSGATSDARTDVYAAGIMLFELLTGLQPHTGESPLAVAYKHVNEVVPPPSSVLPGLSAVVDALVAMATSRDPELRPASADQFLRAIQQVSDGQALPGTAPYPAPAGYDRPAAPHPGPPAYSGPQPWPAAFPGSGPQPGLPAFPGSGPQPGLPAFPGSGPQPGLPVHRGDRAASGPYAGPGGRPDSGSFGVPPQDRAGSGPLWTPAPDSGSHPYQAPGPGSGPHAGPGPAFGSYDPQHDLEPGRRPPGLDYAPEGYPGPGHGASGQHRDPTGRRDSLPGAVGASALPSLSQQTSEMLPAPHADPESMINHTLVVSEAGQYDPYADLPPAGHAQPLDRGRGHRGRRSAGGRREPWLQRYLFSRKLIYLTIGLAVVVAIVLGAWWFNSGQFQKVPVLSGLTLNAARNVLKNQGLEFKLADPVHNPRPKGEIVKVSPAQGSRVASGSPVTLTLSLGPVILVVPNVSGQPEDAAKAYLRSHRLRVGQDKPAVSSSVPAGNVIGTIPRAYTKIPRSKRVRLIVSEGPGLPKFVGMQVTDAQAAAAAGGYTINAVPNKKGNEPANTITSQSPSPDTPITPGEVVTVHYSPGPPAVLVPDVLGMSVTEAILTLRRAGFMVAVNHTGPGDQVGSYDPQGNQPKGTLITINVGILSGL